MAIAFRDAAATKSVTLATNPAMSVSVTIPVTVAAGDLLLCWAAYSINGQGWSIGTPTGWTALGSVAHATQGATYLFWKKATSGDAGSSLSVPYTGGTGTTAFGMVAVVAYSGVDANSAPTFASASESVAGTAHVTPTATAAAAGSVIEAVVDRASKTATWTTPGGFTSRLNVYPSNNGDLSFTVADKTISGAGSVGGDTYTASASSANATMWTLAVVPVTSATVVTPTSDVTTTGWSKVPSDAASFAATVGETAADDSTYVQSPDNPSSSTFEVKFGTMSTPASRDSHQINVRMRAVGASTGTVLVRLMQGTTQIASFTENGLTAGFQTLTYNLTTAQATAITDYTNLRLRIIATAAP